MSNTSEIMRANIECHFEHRALKWPDEMQALAWVNTELAECYELLLARESGWKRNHPEDKQSWSKEAFAEELGDTIYMLCVAGYVAGVDPIAALLSKIDNQMRE